MCGLDQLDQRSATLKRWYAIETLKPDHLGLSQGSIPNLQNDLKQVT